MSLPACPDTLICIRHIVNFLYPASLEITVRLSAEILTIYTRNKYPCKMPRARLVECLGRDGGISVVSQSGLADHPPTTYTPAPLMSIPRGTNVSYF